VTRRTSEWRSGQRASLDELLEQTVLLLATEVDHRWKALFPNRGELSTRADGSISRNVNGHPLPYDAFSTGESMVAIVLSSHLCRLLLV
jgi:hypothetical protein